MSTETAALIGNLLGTMKGKGIVGSYTCPNCSFQIPISGDTQIETLYFCSDCGSKIDVVSLARFLKELVDEKR